MEISNVNLKAGFVGVLQARMGSTRLPGKMLLEVCGKPIIKIMLERMRLSKKIYRWVLATSDKPQDLKLAEIAKDVGFEHFCGNEYDLVDRLYHCAKEFDIKYIVRVCGDNPLLDPRIVDDTIKNFIVKRGNFDYFSNHHPPTFPDGQEVEIIPFRSIAIVWKEAKQPHEREHGTPYLWDQPERFKLGNYQYSGKNLYLDFRWTLDYPEDYEMIKAVFEELYPLKQDFGMDDILKLLQNRPDIADLNKIHRGKTWHLFEQGRLSTIEQYPQRKRMVQGNEQ